VTGGIVFGYVQRKDSHWRADCLAFVDVAAGDVEFLKHNALLGLELAEI
jgi:hypothetical protein